MRLPEPGRTAQETAPGRGWVLLQLLRRIFPLWLTLAAAGCIAALCWRAQGWAPDFTALSRILSCVYWLAALWLALGWQHLSSGCSPAADANRLLGRSLVLLGACACAAVLLALAPFALCLAYDPGSPLHTLRPLDTGELRITIFPLMFRLCGLAGPAFLLLSLGLLLAARRGLGYNNGTWLWLGLGVLLHSPFWLESPQGSLPCSFAAFSGTVQQQLMNSDLLLSEQIFGPLALRLALVWGAVLLLLLVCLMLRQPRRRCAAVLWPACAAGLLAVALQAAQIALRWQQDALQHELHGLLDLPWLFALCAAACWLALHSTLAPAPASSRAFDWQGLLPFALLLQFAAVPLLLQSPLAQAQYAAATVLALLGLLAVVSAVRAGGGLPGGIAVSLLFFGPWPQFIEQGERYIPAILRTALFTADQRLPALLIAASIGLACAGLLACTMLRRQGMSRGQRLAADTAAGLPPD